MEAAIEVGLSAMISVAMLESESFQNSWEIASIVFAITCLGVLIIFPFQLRKLIKRHVEETE